MTIPDGQLLIRQATREDVPFVAQCMLASVDLYDFKHESVENEIALKVCSLDDTLYSWRNARIAEVGEVPAGCLISYDGGTYLENRERTFRYFREAGRSMDDSEEETGPGEFYLDSMAVRPEFRGYGIGHCLIKDAISAGRNLGFSRFSLIAECSKPDLRCYYAELGFKEDREIHAFGEKYLKMILETECHR